MNLTERILAGKHGHNIGALFQALTLAKGNKEIAAAIAYEKFKGTRPVVQEHIKASIAAGTGVDASWSGPLVSVTPLATEFANIIAPLTILGRVAFRKVPFDVKFAAATAGTGAAWVQEGNSIPVSAMSFAGISLGYNKLAAMSVITDELAAYGSPDVSAMIAADHIRAAAELADLSLLNPAAAVPGVSPASITHGAETAASSGATSVETLADLKAAFDYFTTNKIPLSESVLILSEATALAWALLTTSSGNLLFPQLNGVAGGAILGVPVITSLFAVTCATLVHPDSVAVADGGTEFDVTQEATIQMDSAPATPPTTPVSLWQQHMTGCRSQRFLNWAVRRAAAVYVISGTPT
jgi:HK97 family phage major capsid protein